MSLRAWRQQRALSLRELAAASKLNHNTIALIEGGKIRLPRYATIRALSAALGVAPAEIREFRPSLGLPAEEGG